MNIICVDDEEPALRSLRRVLADISPEANVVEFLFADEALQYAQTNSVDVAFLDIEMSEMNGISLAEKLKEINKNINIIFVTGFIDYILDAFNLHASGYILKPIDPERVAFELKDLRCSVKKKNEGLYIQCFGYFEVFFNGVPVTFAHAKTKELFAYLVNRGGTLCTKNEIISTIWEERPNSESLQVQYRQLVSDLSAKLRAIGASEILIKRRGELALLTKNIKCDYLDYLNDKRGHSGVYCGEFMEQYSWAEMTKGNILFYVHEP